MPVRFLLENIYVIYLSRKGGESQMKRFYSDHSMKKKIIIYLKKKYFFPQEQFFFFFCYTDKTQKTKFYKKFRESTLSKFRLEFSWSFCGISREKKSIGQIIGTNWDAQLPKWEPQSTPRLGIYWTCNTEKTVVLNQILYVRFKLYILSLLYCQTHLCLFET